MEHADWDVFISHAWEDKEFVRLLANTLVQKGLRIWYDEFTLSVGDSLRESIERGIANSSFGIVVLSPHFFSKKKKWTRNELSALIAREKPGERVILPIWHNITADEIAKVSPILADRIAVSRAVV